ncbi:MAG: class I SAM-dependent methyltransferase [Opitutaceae bacterium]|nr:class I SAM-dependent methyltransferase [Opitutaceae bacterium]
MSTHACPWWLGYLLVTPLRRLLENPAKILTPWVQPRMTVLEPGPGMGFFTLELARLVGPGGRVVAVDLQERMLATLRRRAQKFGLADRIETRRCSRDDLGIGDLAGRVDFVLLFHMLHEVAAPDRFLRTVHTVLKPGCAVLLAEPPVHVSPSAFQASVQEATKLGFEIAEPARGRRLQVLLRRPPI